MFKSTIRKATKQYEFIELNIESDTADGLIAKTKELYEQLEDAFNKDYLIGREKKEVRKCEKCGSDMWDNRGNKFTDKTPDFKCKDKECNTAVWLDSKEK